MTAGSEEARKAINGVLDAHWAAVKAKDADAVISLVTDDFLSCGSDPDEFWNKAEMYNNIKQVFASPGLEVDVTVEKRVIRVAADCNSAIAFEQMYLKPYSRKLQVRTVSHLVKVNNAWLVDFTSTGFIPCNADIEKLNKALE